MGVLFFIPGLISLILVMRGRVESAFLYVYLPSLLLIPYGFAFRLPHLPAISAAQYALLPIAAVAFKRQGRGGMPSLMDILMVLFLVSTAASEILHEQVRNDGIFLTIDNFISIFLSYVVGRRIIEPGLRLAAARQFVIVMLLLGPVALMDWRMGQNLFGLIGERVFDTFLVTANIQMRSGHGRVAASFNDSELAGIVFGMTIALNAWIFYLYRTRSRINLGARITKMEKFHIPGALLLMYLLMTQSRGPLLALMAGYLILLIPRFKNTRLATGVVVVMLAVGAYAAMLYLAGYTNVSSPAAVKDEQQGSALYRVKMNELYLPIAEEGGLLGWGRLSYPAVPSMKSIDNEFLHVRLSYGALGYWLFMLMAWESMRSLVVRSWKLRGLEDRAFAFSMLAALAVFWISITTVYMGEQLPQIAFLLIGWGQSIEPGSTETAAAPAETQPARFAFRRVFN